MKKENHCSVFPDRWKLIVDFDIANICQGHDMLYEALVPTCTRKEADLWMFNELMRYNKDLHILWGLVYVALRRFGWIPWYIHRIQNFIGEHREKTEWAKVRGYLENTSAFT